MRDQGETSLADRKAKRLEEKSRSKEKQLGMAMALINGDDTVFDTITRGSQTKSTRGGSSGDASSAFAEKGARRMSRKVSNAGNLRHASIYIGKMNSRQYATLDGEFHVDSQMGVNDAVPE